MALCGYGNKFGFHWSKAEAEKELKEARIDYSKMTWAEKRNQAVTLRTRKQYAGYLKAGLNKHGIKF